MWCQGLCLAISVAFKLMKTLIKTWTALAIPDVNIVISCQFLLSLISELALSVGQRVECQQSTFAAKTREGKMLWWDDSFQREHGCQRPQIGKHSSCCLTDIYESLACRWRDHCLLPKHKDSANPKEGASQNVKLIDTGREWLFC